MKFAIFCLATSLAAVCVGVGAGPQLRKRSVDGTNPQNEANKTPGQNTVKSVYVLAQRTLQAPQYPPTNWQSPNYQPANYPPPNYQQPNYPPPNYQQPNYQQPNYQQPNYPPPNYPPPNYPPPNYPPANYPQPPTTTADPMCPQGPSGECRELPLGQRGSIQVRNDGGVPLQFFVEYKVRGRKIFEESGLFTYTYKRIKEIPADAEDIILTVQGVWIVTSDIMKKQWKYPVIRCYSSTDGQRVTQVGCN